MMKTILLVLGLSMPILDVRAEDVLPEPGLYEVTITLELPNVAATGVGPSVRRRCLSAEDMRSGSAFGVLGDNPLRACPLKDYTASNNRALYRIECPGPNAPFAAGVFDLGKTGFRGVITMNMGGKNMTMSEHQRGRRVGACQ